MYNPNIHHRRSIRLKGYDYSQDGTYFVTICTANRECIFGEIVEGNMILNDIGRIANDELHKTSMIRRNVKMDCTIVMPNHIHAIVVIDNNVGTYSNTPLQKTDTPFRSPSHNLGAIIRGYKSTVTKQVNILRKTPGEPVWQRNYYENIIRDESSWNHIREYVKNNPQKWEEDRFFTP